MTSGEGSGKVSLQRANASGNSQVTQVAGDYEEHHHRYVRGWEYLRGIRVADAEMDLVDNAFVDPPGPDGWQRPPGRSPARTTAIRSW
ncbi:hypothetical protein [Streptomyces ardesiacus]|uniref:hypothetical protein n=1 Tax=Streptomyces ardesiacus TaxID=285564 RepID=UPI00363AF0E5